MGQLRRHPDRRRITLPLDADDEQVLLLRRLNAASERLTQALAGPRPLAVEVLDAVRFVSNLDRGLLILRGHAGQFRVAAARGLERATPAEHQVLATAGVEAAHRRTSRLDHDPRTATVRGGLLVSLVLEHRGHVLGALVLQGSFRGLPLSPIEASFLRGLARQVAQTLVRWLRISREARGRAATA